MARMIPNIVPHSIENNGERLFYEAAGRLPDDYTVLYSFKYMMPETQVQPETIREADFVIVHPSLGFLTIEVKQGEVSYRNGEWQSNKNGTYAPLKNPVEQARTAMFAILNYYEQVTRTKYFPLKKRYAVAFPQCNTISGTLPPDLVRESVFIQEDLSRLKEKIPALFGPQEPHPEAARTLVQKVLAPSFDVFSRLDQQIEMFNQQSHRLLTEEQERILDETELDKQKIFFGAAGTGKTFLAMEKAKRLSQQGHKVLLTCFNKNLAAYMSKALETTNITIANFHDYILRTLQEGNSSLTVPDDPQAISLFFDITLPEAGFDYFASQPERNRFDALIVDEGQDFREEWFSCLEAMLKQGGYFYIFADPGQSLFSADSAFLKKLPHSRHRLTQNLRNTEAINRWLTAFIPPNIALKSRLPGGHPVSTFTWQTPQEEKRLIEQEVGRLVSQGIKPKRIVILSPNKKEKNSLADTASIKGWPIKDIDDSNPNAIRFSTIRSFKGLEADIVFLIGIKDGSQACTPADVYVGGSRARFLLYVFQESSYAIPKKN